MGADISSIHGECENSVVTCSDHHHPIAVLPGSDGIVCTVLMPVPLPLRRTGKDPFRHSTSSLARNCRRTQPKSFCTGCSCFCLRFAAGFSASLVATSSAGQKANAFS